MFSAYIRWWDAHPWMVIVYPAVCWLLYFLLFKILRIK